VTRPAWLSDLLDAGAYPGSPSGAVELIQTHASFVFLVGSDVYKLKKAVRTAFLDYSTVELRQLSCEEEVRVNEALAPGIYLGTLPVVEDPRTRRVRVGGEGKRVDTVVHMRRLADEDLLSARVASRRVAVTDLHAVARRVAQFHTRASRGPEVDRASMPAAMGRLLLGNLEECRPFAGDIVTHADLTVILRFYHAALSLFRPAIEARIRAGRAIDGHGDLRLEHVCLEQDPPALLDRIEFDPSLRYGDAALDLSFLVFELCASGRHDLARALVSDYVNETLDAELPAMLDLFCTHRALVRAKVERIRSRETEVAPEDRRRSAARARRLFSLARTLARPLWIGMTGLPGTGKSTVAGALAGPLDRGACLRTDALRGGIPAEERYTPGGIAQAYGRLRDRAVRRAHEGHWSVLDATFGDRSERDEFEEAAAEAGADVLWVHCHCPEEVALERLAQRASAGTDPSEADASVRGRLAARYEPPDELAPERLLDLCTVSSPEELESRARAWIFRARPVEVLRGSADAGEGEGE
jgi:aminoglycoside phosphotransferase family enzyme/predicted kinase